MYTSVTNKNTAIEKVNITSEIICINGIRVCLVKFAEITVTF